MMTDHEGNLSFISYSEYDENDYLISNIVVDPLTDPQNIEDCGVRPWVYNFKYDNLGNCIEEKFYLGESYAQKTEWIYEYYD